MIIALLCMQRGSRHNKKENGGIMIEIASWSERRMQSASISSPRPFRWPFMRVAERSRKKIEETSCMCNRLSGRAKPHQGCFFFQLVLLSRTVENVRWDGKFQFFLCCCCIKVQSGKRSFRAEQKTRFSSQRCSIELFWACEDVENSLQAPLAGLSSAFLLWMAPHRTHRKKNKLLL